MRAKSLMSLFEFDRRYVFFKVSFVLVVKGLRVGLFERRDRDIGQGGSYNEYLSFDCRKILFTASF